MLAEYAAHARELGATAVRMVATSATRDAANRADFEDMVVAILGQRPDVVDGHGGGGAVLHRRHRFARRGGRGPRRRAARPPFLVVDIGGGSTEFVLGDATACAPRAPSTSAASG